MQIQFHPASQAIVPIQFLCAIDMEVTGSLKGHSAGIILVSLALSPEVVGVRYVAPVIVVFKTHEFF